MNSFFEKLGATVLKQWRQQNFSLDAFPEIAQTALEESPPSELGHLDELVREFLLNDEQPFQSQSGFGQPELVAFVDQRFYIQILFWMDGTTDIHQHEFSGAFHVMSGASIHAEFDFETRHSITPHLRIGELQMKKIELLETGRTVPITSGRDCIHSLFHLDTPSVTVVVRTQHDPGTGPQYNYLPPHIAIDPIYADGLTMRRNHLLHVLDSVEHPDYADLVREMIGNLDFERGFITLQHSMNALQQLDQWDTILEAFRSKHGDLTDGVADTLAESLRRDTIAAMRQHVVDPDHRFFLALLMNAPTREDILALIPERYPDQPAIETIMTWAYELIEPTDLGLTLLDAIIPETLDIPFEDQPELLITALKNGIEGVELTDSIDDLSEIHRALNESCLSILFHTTR